MKIDRARWVSWLLSLAFHGGLAWILLVQSSSRTEERHASSIELFDHVLPDGVDVKPPISEDAAKPQLTQPTEALSTPSPSQRTRPIRRQIRSSMDTSVTPTPKTEASDSPTAALPIVEMDAIAPSNTGTGVTVSPLVGRPSPGGTPPSEKTAPQPGGGFKTQYRRGESAPSAALTTPPKVTEEVKPNYPEAIRELGIEGKVVLEITIDGEGRVIAARVMQSLHPVLDQEAIVAAKQMRFQPAAVNDVPVQVTWRYTFVFVLD